MTTKLKAMLVSVLLALPVPAAAVPVQGFGAGTAVTQVDLSTNLDFIVEGSSLDLVSAGGLTFDLTGIATCQHGSCSAHPPFSGFSGGVIFGGGSDFPLIITTSDGSELAGIEFVLGTGAAEDHTGGFWEAYRDGVLTGSGGFNVPGFPDVFALSDTAGFDELRIAMYETSGTPGGFSGLNAIAIDNVIAQQLQTEVPEPACLALLGLGLAGLGWSRRRK